jgi:hypothetical protein
MVMVTTAVLLTATPSPLNAFDQRESLVARIMVLDRLLRRPQATWTGPATGLGLFVGALTFSLAAVYAPTASGADLGALVLGVVIGAASTVAGIIAGCFGASQAAERGSHDLRRELLLEQLRRYPDPPDAAPTSPESAPLQ